MAKHRNNIFIVLVIVGTLVTFGLVFYSLSSLTSELPVSTNYASEFPEGSQDLSPDESKTLEIASPDGKFTMRLETENIAEGTYMQKIYIWNIDNEVPLEVYSGEFSEAELVSVPLNTFSPNNKYILLNYEASGEKRYLVLRTDGENIRGEQKTVEIKGLFTEKHPGFVITDVTGWGSYNVVVVNTDNPEGKMGPSWWFDLTNFSFIRLASRFN